MVKNKKEGTKKKDLTNWELRQTFINLINIQNRYIQYVSIWIVLMITLMFSIISKDLFFIFVIILFGGFFSYKWLKLNQEKDKLKSFKSLVEKYGK